MSSRTQGKLVVLIALLALLSGCGGVNAGYGVSPASFLIPGLDVHAPAPAAIAPLAELTPAR